MKKPLKVEKSLGDGTTVMVDNPDLYTNELGYKLKHRKATNYTPKKKRRTK